MAAGIDPPRDLTIPDPGSTTAHRVLSRAIGRLITELLSIGRAAAVARAAGPDIGAFQRVMTQALKTGPGAVASALRSPSIGGLLRCLRPAQGQAKPYAESICAEFFSLMGLELARTGSLPGPLRLRRMPARLLSLPGRFAISLPPGATGLLFENGRLVIERGPHSEVFSIDLILNNASAGGRVTKPYLPIAGDIVLALADNNPLAMEEAHPDKSGNAIHLGGRPESEWVEAIRSALELIGHYMPDLRREIDLYIHQVVPVGYDPERHVSASYQEAIGTIYMSLHPSPITMVEAVIHEFSHNKLNALFELDDVLENAWSPLYTSPVRPDPRPLHGVLLAVHAFLPVARLYELMIEAGDPLSKNTSFLKRFEYIKQGNREGAEVILENGRPTAVGEGLLDEIRRWNALCSPSLPAG
jgi:HEXXH motif-containing protein